jgi:hypothetical protein
MKKLFVALLALISCAAFGTTFVPVQLLNPTGSTSGQAIISTGASSAPAWGNVSAAALTGLVPTANGGLGANYGSASGVPVLAAGVSTITATTGTGSVVLGTSPTITTPNIQGVTGGTTAASGQVGQPLTATGTAVSITNSTPANCTSINLPAGDWNVWGNVNFNPGSGTAFSLMQSGFNTTSATLPAAPNYSAAAFAGTTNFGQSSMPPQQIYNVSTATTVYLVANGGFAGGTATVSCFIDARRMH